MISGRSKYGVTIGREILQLTSWGTWDVKWNRMLSFL